MKPSVIMVAAFSIYAAPLILGVYILWVLHTL